MKMWTYRGRLVFAYLQRKLVISVRTVYTSILLILLKSLNLGLIIQTMDNMDFYRCLYKMLIGPLFFISLELPLP